jgi:hypothetical protein
MTKSKSFAVNRKDEESGSIHLGYPVAPGEPIGTKSWEETGIALAVGCSPANGLLVHGIKIVIGQ